MSERSRYPLCWPEGWARTPQFERRSSRFSGIGGRHHSMEESCAFLQAELGRLCADKEILSTNVKLRLDGLPYSGSAAPMDPGVAVYFELEGSKPIALACDKWVRVEDNVWAIAKHIESLRGQERWGVGATQRAFAGYTALPGIGESSAADWWKTLGVAINASADQVREAYRLLVKRHHPDVAGGDRELFERVQNAMDRFERSLRETKAA